MPHVDNRVTVPNTSAGRFLARRFGLRVGYSYAVVRAEAVAGETFVELAGVRWQRGFDLGANKHGLALFRADLLHDQCVQH